MDNFDAAAIAMLQAVIDSVLKEIDNLSRE